MLGLGDFVAHAPVESEVLESYGGRVPEELIDLWRDYGYGALGDGFLRVINPAEYEAEIGGHRQEEVVECCRGHRGRIGEQIIPVVVEALSEQLPLVVNASLDAPLVEGVVGEVNQYRADLTVISPLISSMEVRNPHDSL